MDIVFVSQLEVLYIQTQSNMHMLLFINIEQTTILILIPVSA